MKKTMTVSRRELLRVLQGGASFAIVISAPALLASCSKAELDCKDTEGLDKAAMQLRTTLQYQDHSPHGDAKTCSKCQFYKSAPNNECGGCTLVQGPINPGGYCNSWAPKES